MRPRFVQDVSWTGGKVVPKKGGHPAPGIPIMPESLTGALCAPWAPAPRASSARTVRPLASRQVAGKLFRPPPNLFPPLLHLARLGMPSPCPAPCRPLERGAPADAPIGLSELKKRAQRKMQSIGDVRHRGHGWIIFTVLYVAQACDMNSACVTQLPQAHALEVAMMAYHDANEIHIIFFCHRSIFLRLDYFLKVWHNHSLASNMLLNISGLDKLCHCLRLSHKSV